MSETRGPSDGTQNAGTDAVADSAVQGKQEQRSSTPSTVSNGTPPLAEEKRAAAAAEEQGTHLALTSENEKQGRSPRMRREHPKS